MRTRRWISVGLVMTIATMPLLASPAHAESPDQIELIKDALARVPERYGLTSDPASAPKTSRIDIPVNPSEGLEILSDGGDIAIGLPFGSKAARGFQVNKNAIAYDNRNGSLTVPSGKRDGSIQIATVITSPTAPVEYPYAIATPGLEKITLLPDGAAAFMGSGRAFLGGAAAPWAVDAIGQSVPTHFTVSGSTLTQVVDHLSGDFTYPIVADPWMGRSLYHYAYVSYHTQGRKVNAQPTNWGVQYSGPVTWTAHKNEVKTRLGADASKYNASMEQQHYCHLLGVPLSLPVFNLESWRPVMTASAQAPYKCNYPEGYYF
jgi:hypothetical protein